MIQAAGFLTVVICSALLDGEAWLIGLIAALVGAAMMAIPEIAKRRT